MQGRAATCQLRSRAQPACACAHTRLQHCARCFSGGGAARALRRARAAPRWLWSFYALWKGTAPARGLSPSVQRHALTCQPRPPAQPACAYAHTQSRHCARSLSGGGASRALAARARRAALVVVGPYPKVHCTSKEPLPFGARRCFDVPAAASNEQPACACAHTRSRHCARCLSGGGAARALAARARRAALVVVGLCLLKGHCTSEMPLSFGPRPCFDMPAAASN